MIPTQLEELKFCRVKKKTKKPFEKEYKDILNFLPSENYGVLCGYEDLAVIDSDHETLQLAIDNLLPDTYKVKTPSGGTHNYFFIPELKQKLILDLDNTHLGEVQSHGTQVVGPGSIHPNGKKYEEINNLPVTKISCEKLYEVVKPFMKEIKESEELAKLEIGMSSEIDDLDVTQIWNASGLKKQGNEYYGEHPVHGSDGGMNFWINPLKNTWHCFRCNSGGGPLSAIAVKEGLIECSEAQRGNLRGEKALQSIKIAEEKYGLKNERPLTKKERHPLPETPVVPKKEIPLLWDKELQEWEETEQDWIIDRLIPNRSIVVLTGKRGTLKTFMTLSMAYSVAGEIDFLDNFKSRKGTVIYLDKENGISIMKKRTTMIKNGLNMNGKDLKVGFICFSQLKIDKLGDIHQIEELITKHTPSLLIIDTYRRGISFDENDAGKVSELFVDILRPLVEKHNISIVLIHHNRKGGTGEVPDEMDEIRGSSDLANYSDIIFKLERKGEFAILKQLKNRNAPEETDMKIKVTFTEDSVKLSYDGEYEKQTQSGKCSEILLKWFYEKQIEQFKTKDARDIAFKAGIKETNFKWCLKEMQDVGAIEKMEFGIYKVNNNKEVFNKGIGN